MHIRTGDNSKNNFAWHKISQIVDLNKKYAPQTKEQAHIPTSQEAGNSIKDSVVVSAEAKQKEKEEKEKRKQKNELEEMASRYQELSQQLEKAREQGEAMGESMKTRMKCLLIAMRIMSGDKVPPEDYRYLAKNDLELYSKAVSMRIERDDPKKHKRLSEDEKSSDNKEAGNSESASASTEAVQATDSGEVQAEASPDSSANQEST